MEVKYIIFVRNLNLPFSAFFKNSDLLNNPIVGVMIGVLVTVLVQVLVSCFEPLQISEVIF